MYIIKKLTNEKKYVMPKKPNFSNKKSELIWLRRQKMKALMLNIKSIQIQIKDIKEFRYSNDEDLIRLYIELYPFEGYDDEEYITISKFKKGNYKIIYSILNTDWLINKDNLSKVSDYVLEMECVFLENRMKELLNRKEIPVIANCIEHCKYKLEVIKKELKERKSDQIVNLKLT